MPIYDYTCSNCRRVTEVIHGINDHGPKFCPECGAEGTMTKKFVAPTVHFKGSGWAKKDRTSSARSARAKDDTAASSGEGDSSAAESGSGSGSGSGKGAPSSKDPKSDKRSSESSTTSKASTGGSTPSSDSSD